MRPMKIYIGADPGGPHLGYIFPFSMMMVNYLKNCGHYITLDPDERVEIALCIAFKPTYDQVRSLQARGAKIVHRLDGRVRSLVKVYEQDEVVRRINRDLADWTVFQSEYVKRHMTLQEKTIFGIEEPICTRLENSSIIYNGVDRSIFNEKGDTFTLEGKFNILHVSITGGIRKGANYVLKIAEYLENNPDIHFYFIGNQDRDLSCGHLIRAGVYRNVKHLGVILDQHLLAKYMRSCQVLLYPSVHDYCPNTVLEAMSCGLPVWYHNSGGTPELVRRGRYVGGVPITPENDIQPLYVLLNGLEDFREQAIAIVRENFTSEIVGQQYLELFERLLASSTVAVRASQVPDTLSSNVCSNSRVATTPATPVRANRFNHVAGKIIRRVSFLIKRASLWALYKLAKLYLQRAQGNHAPLLKYGVHSLGFADGFAPLSSEGRGILQFWFEVQRYVEKRINQVCNRYYNNQHPRHYLWLGHNRYLYDGVRTGERVLDIGCGASYYQQWIAEKAAEVVGVDILPDCVELARLNNQKSNVCFELTDVTRDLPEGQFDVVICSHVLEHLDDPISVLTNLAKKVPRLLVKVPLIDAHWMKLVKRDIGMFWMDDADHRREYTEDLLREQLEKSGWQITEIIRGYDLRATAVSTYFSGTKSTKRV
jgi:glycosyltransferase involved in cell wall biosynthesis/SAM-dependent methyltransferase